MFSLQSIALIFLSLVGSNLTTVNSNALEARGWKVDQFWETRDNVFVSTFRSSKIVDECRSHPKSNLFFPRVVHASHFISLGKADIAAWGTNDFSEVRSFYGAPVIACKTIVASGASELTWRIVSYSHFFSRLQDFPKVQDGINIGYLLNEGFNVFAAGGLVMLALFSFLIYIGKTDKRMLFSLVVSPFLFSLYFIFNSCGLLGISINMLSAHRIADSGLWIGILLIFYAYSRDKVLSKFAFFFSTAGILIGLLIIMIGKTGDIIQFGTTIPFIPVGFGLVNVLLGAISKSYINGVIQRVDIFRILSVLAFVIVSFNDMLSLNGYLNTDLWLPIGLACGFGFFSLSVNEHIQEAYNERDHLRKNLEFEVEHKTKELRDKTQRLETAYTDLRLAQAEVVNSAKLAGLGTMAAGIAHEINNALNYVNGSIRPLQKKVDGLPMSAEEKVKIDSFFEMIKEGLKQTFEIIQSLRNYTGLNKASIDEVVLSGVVRNVLTLLKSKIDLDAVQVDVAVPDSHKVFGSIVGLNQVMMNLVTNALDAIRESPNVRKLQISSSISGETLLLKIEDSGIGMSEQVREKMFDPFFTTKEVGKGTGLGMHIVKKELDRFQAGIVIKSQVGKGTSIEITFPLKDVFEVAV